MAVIGSIWPCIVPGEATIDVAAFGQPIIAIDENNADDARTYVKLMEGAAKGVPPEQVMKDQE